MEKTPLLITVIVMVLFVWVSPSAAAVISNKSGCWAFYVMQTNNTREGHFELINHNNVPVVIWMYCANFYDTIINDNRHPKVLRLSSHVCGLNGNRPVAPEGIIGFDYQTFRDCHGFWNCLYWFLFQGTPLDLPDYKVFC